MSKRSRGRLRDGGTPRGPSLFAAAAAAGSLEQCLSTFMRRWRGRSGWKPADSDSHQVDQRYSAGDRKIAHPHQANRGQTDELGVGIGINRTRKSFPDHLADSANRREPQMRGRSERRFCGFAEGSSTLVSLLQEPDGAGRYSARGLAGLPMTKVSSVKV